MIPSKYWEEEGKKRRRRKKKKIITTIMFALASLLYKPQINSIL
jgi:hypothetical protein